MLRELVSNEWYTLLLVITMGLITVIKLAYSVRFNDFLTLIGNSKYLKIYSRDQKFIDLFDAVLFLNLIISIALFVVIIVRYQSDNFDMAFGLFLKLILGIGVFFLIKVLTERLIGSLFEIDSLIDSYLFQKISYRNFIGMALVPINILLMFTINPSIYVVYVVVFILLAINVIGLITTIKANQKLLINNLFYFILYLCALEIAPYIILYKLIIM